MLMVCCNGQLVIIYLTNFSFLIDWKRNFSDVSSSVLENTIDVIGNGIKNYNQKDWIGQILTKCSEVCQVYMTLQEANNIFLTSMYYL
jgi:hypothetical protein